MRITVSPVSYTHLDVYKRQRPFFSDKFDITKHPKYKYLSDADPKNAFDMEKHLKRLSLIHI